MHCISRLQFLKAAAEGRVEVSNLRRTRGWTEARYRSLQQSALSRLYLGRKREHLEKCMFILLYQASKIRASSVKQLC